MKRRFVNFGIFSYRIVKGKEIQDHILEKVYVLLKMKGFKETPWQYVYEGQLGGLVLPYNDSKNEIHVRFYQDRVVSEFEIGRSYVTHFLGPRYNANRYLYDFLSSSLHEDEKEHLQSMLCNSRLLDDEKEMLCWDSKSDNFTTIRARERLLSVSFLGLSLHFGWKTSFLVIAMCLFAVSFSESLAFNALATVAFAFLWNLLPSKGRP